MPKREFYLLNVDLHWGDNFAQPGEIRNDLFEADVPELLAIGWISGPYKREDLAETTVAGDERPRYVLRAGAEEGGE